MNKLTMNLGTLLSVENLMINEHQILHIEEHGFDDGYAEFGGGWTDWKQIVLIDLKTGEITDINRSNWPIMQTIYEKAKLQLHWKHARPGFATLRQVYSILMRVKPYEEWTAKQQFNSDKRTGAFPNPDSKYAPTLIIQDLEHYRDEVMAGVADNINDARIYRDPDYRESRSYRREMETISRIDDCIENLENPKQ